MRGVAEVVTLTILVAIMVFMISFLFLIVPKRQGLNEKDKEINRGMKLAVIISLVMFGEWFYMLVMFIFG